MSKFYLYKDKQGSSRIVSASEVAKLSSLGTLSPLTPEETTLIKQGAQAHEIANNRPPEASRMHYLYIALGAGIALISIAVLWGIYA